MNRHSVISYSSCNFFKEESLGERPLTNRIKATLN